MRNEQYVQAAHTCAVLQMPPGVMEHFETATRDPAFFRLHKYIDNLFKMHKDLLPPYTRDEVTTHSCCL
jgi:hypothetical protein